MKVVAEFDIEVSVDFIIKRIHSYVASRRWSRTRLAKEARLPHHTSLRNFDSPAWNPTVELLRKLEKLVPADFDPAQAGVETVKRRAKATREWTTVAELTTVGVLMNQRA